VKLPRIAVIIGENSTGKTTLLGCCNAFARLASNQNAMEYDPFNIYPFQMGSFESLARAKSKFFSLGGSINGIELEFQFGEDSGRVVEHEVKIKPQDLEQLTISRNGSTGEWKMTTPSFDISVSPSRDRIPYSQISQWLAFAVRHGDFPYREELEQARKKGHDVSDESQKTKLNAYLEDLSRELPWDPIITEAVSPYLEPQKRQFGGQEVLPMDPHESEELSEIGRQLTLFDQIRIQRTAGSNFALEVQFKDHFFNISDVGLGISAILPTLRALCASPIKTILLQQPEAHLHPVAQAQLAELMAKSRHQFIVESHSDFMINRLSICVRKKALDCGDVGILWLEKVGEAVMIHELKFDEEGNLLGAPAKYREFFNKETDDFLGIEQHVYANDH